jgi:hypothetical protein
MESRVSLLCSQEPATSPYSEPHASSHTFQPLFPKILILTSTPRSSEWSLPFRFSNQNTLCISRLFHACYMPRLSHHPWFDHRNDTFLQPPTPSPSQHLVLKHSPYSSVRCERPSHPYKTTGRIIVLYILIFKFLERRRKIQVSEQNGSKHSPNSVCT